VVSLEPEAVAAVKHVDNSATVAAAPDISITISSIEQAALSVLVKHVAKLAAVERASQGEAAIPVKAKLAHPGAAINKSVEVN